MPKPELVKWLDKCAKPVLLAVRKGSIPCIEVQDLILTVRGARGCWGCWGCWPMSACAAGFLCRYRLLSTLCPAAGHAYTGTVPQYRHNDPAQG
jgi:hypothetical protein